MNALKIPSYKINLIDVSKYEFESIGPKGNILKVVEITALERRNTFNFGFGDLEESGLINDQTETNNGDLLRIFSTIIDIVNHYLTSNPYAILYFSGSTKQRTKVYHYIVKRNFELLSKDYDITAIVNKQETLSEVDFNPLTEETYLAFFIRKKLKFENAKNGKRYKS